MKSTTAMIMLINLRTSSNVPELMNQVGLAWYQGFTAETVDEAGRTAECWALALPNCSINHKNYRSLCHRIGLLDHGNKGPITIETDGKVFMTLSSSTTPVTVEVGELCIGPGAMTIKVNTGDLTKVYGINPLYGEERDIFYDH